MDDLNQQPMSCRLCGADTRLVAQQLLLERHDVALHQCPACDLIQTEQPHWLSEAYASAICATDTGAIARNMQTATLTSVVANLLALPMSAKCLDFGGGHGVFVRMMRDRGRAFEWFDTYAANHYAGGFEGDPSRPHDLVTSLEVFEHLADVSGAMEQLFGPRPAVVLAGTMLHRGHEPGWWYYTPHTGQHVAFYSTKTMRHIADRFGYAVAGSRAYTLFVRKNSGLSPWRVRAAQAVVHRSKGDRIVPLIRTLDTAFGHGKPLTLNDCRTVMSRLRDAA